MTSQTLNNESVKSTIYNKSNWVRLVFMLLFALLLHIAAAVMWVLCILQFSFSVLTGQDNENLRYLGDSVAKFVQQALRYLSYNSEQKPFPFADWPEPEVQEATEGRQAQEVPESDYGQQSDIAADKPQSNQEEL